MSSIRKHTTGIRIVAAAVLMMCCTSLAYAVGGDNVMYMGGTLGGVKEKAEGKFITTSDSELQFKSGDGTASIPYSSVTTLEYGQKAGRRVGVAIMISPLALFSKKRKHYLTVTYKDAAGKEQAGVFELGKDIVRTTLKIVEVRTGKVLEFQDLEACRQYKTPKECQATK